ncbi:MAG: hypothetical protein IJD93_03400 [Ruminococcus sp.]|nr:hypothetical protein [Ruminococcus sp.]
MKVFFKNFISILLVLTVLCSSFVGVSAQTASKDETEIVSTDMTLAQAENNAEKYFSTNKDMTEKYPDGLYVIEYNSYGIYEGGSDPQNPEDLYLGMNVYRIGGYSSYAELTFAVSPVVADSEVYPASQGTIEFEPQQRVSTAKIKIHNDDVRKGDQILMVSLLEASCGEISEGSSAIVTITDDEPYVESLISVTVDKAVTDVNEGSVAVTLKRTNTSVEYCTLVLKTSDGSAKAGVDYEQTETEVMFGPGTTEQIVRIPLLQSEELYSDSKYFNIELCKLAACQVDGESKIRVDITNKVKNGADKLTQVSGKANLEIDDSMVVSEAAVPVVNINDTIDRKQLLISAIGAASGEAVQAVPNVDLLESAGVWKDEVILHPSDFKETYRTGDTKWNHSSQFSNGNENLLLTSRNRVDLNLFKSIRFRYDNDEWGANGNPNTAMGYLNQPSDKSEDFFFTKSQLDNCSTDDLNWMKSEGVYFLIDENNKNVDYLEDGKEKSLSDSSNNRYVGSAGLDGADQYLFYMLYDDKGWDDHHFNMGNTTLYRDIIPFSAFESEYIDENSFAADEKGFSFTMDNYKWVVTVADATQGGVSVCNENASQAKDKYGFYAGSLLKVDYSVLSEGSVVPSPKRISLLDADGNVHNVGSLSNTDSSFTVSLSTIMNDNLSELQNRYGMNEKEAKDHVNNTLSESKCITSSFKLKLGFKAEYSLQQSISLNFDNVPLFAEPVRGDSGYLESDNERRERVLNAFDGAITFYDENGNDITPELEKADMKFNIIHYPVIDFDYIKVSPASIGNDFLFSSNLYDLDYKTIESTVEIPDEICYQVSTGAVFTLLTKNTTYLKPQLTPQSVMISQRIGNSTDFDTTYIADKLDSFIPFEYLYSDTSASPVPSYYTLKMNISNIYLEGMTEAEEKKFNVNVNRSKTNGQETERLFSFAFVGGTVVTDETEVEITNVSEKFKAKSTSSTDSDPYKPVVKLLSYSENGYEYVIYIPSVYNYQLEAQGSSDTRYETIFEGNDGISVELEDYDKNTHISNVEEASEKSIISYIDISDTQYVCQKVPTLVTDSEDESVESVYFKEQKQFPTYNENNILVGLSGMSIDTTNTGLFLSTLFKDRAKGNDYSRWNTASKVAGALAGSTIYAKFNNQQILIGAKLSIGGGKVEKDDDSILPEEKVPLLTGDATNKNKSINVGVAKIVGSGSVEACVQLDYSHIYREFRFSKVSVTVAGAFAVSGQIPIPATAGAVYITIGTSLACQFSTSYNQVLDYVDNEGKSHYVQYFNGLTVNPAVSISAGFGVGLSGVLAFEGSVAINAAFSISFGDMKISASQQEFDVTTRPTAVDNQKSQKFGTVATFDGDWEYIDMSNETNGERMYEDYYFGDTRCVSNLAGDKLTIKTSGTAFQLTGIRNNRGGIIKVTVYNTDTKEELTSALVDTYSEKEKRYQTLFYWQMDNYESATPIRFTVEIEHIENSDTKGEKVALDSYRVHNSKFFFQERTGFTFNSFVLKLGLTFKFVIGPFDFVLEPAYMQIVRTEGRDTLTLGTVGYYKTYDITARTLNQNENIPVVMATAYTAEEVSDIDYFNTGEYGEQKTISTVANNVEHSSKTQVLNHTRKVNGANVTSDYSFYSKLTRNEATNEAVYGLYYAIDGVEQGVVSDDVMVSDFYAFEDENGTLNVALITTDSTIKSINGTEGSKVTVTFADGTSKVIEETTQIESLLKAYCVKLAVFDDDNRIIVKEIGATSGNNRQENRPVVASYPSGNTVLFYTEDEPTEFKASYDLNFSGFNDELNKSVQSMTELINSTYSGRARIYYTFKDSNGEFIAPVSMNLENAIGEEKFKTGFKITSMDAIMYDENTVCLTFAAEIPYVYAQDENIKGTLKEIYYCTGEVKDKELNFSSMVVVDSVVDYTENISELGLDIEKLSSKYYNRETGDIYDDIILSNVQLEKAVVGLNNTDVTAEDIQPVLFYQTNSSINYATYKTLEGVINDSKEEDLSVKVLYDDNFDDYVIVADKNGAVSLIYNDSTESGAFTDTLNIMNYDAQHSLWNSPRRLTYTDVFDQVAYDNRTDTSSLVFDNLSAYVDEKGKIVVSLRSSCVPFSYDYGVIQGDLEKGFATDMDEADGLCVHEDGTTEPMIITPVLDYDSKDARTDIALLTFEKPVTDFEVTDFFLDNTVFIEGNRIEASFNIVNTGDTIVDNLKASFYYYDLSSGTSGPIFATKTLTNSFVAGHAENVLLSYTVDEAPDNKLLCVKITNSTGRTVYYDSYTDSYLKESKNITYHKIDLAAEFLVSANKVEIDSSGVMNFSVAVHNVGEIDAKNDVVVSCNWYDDSLSNVLKGTLFSFTVAADELSSGGSYVFTNDFDVSDKLIDNKLYYSFKISAKDAQYSTANDTTNVAFAEQTPDIETNSIIHTSNGIVNNVSTDGHRIFDIRLGDEIELKNDVLSSYYTDGELRAYEIGSDCLSIYTSASDGTVKIKAIALPENGEYVKLLLGIKGTTIFKYIYLNITNTDTIDLGEQYAESGWTLSSSEHLYAKNYDIISTDKNGSQLNFTFNGKNLRLYGDYLAEGGSFEITITDKEGNVVEKKLVDTKTKLNDYGMLMFVSKELEFGRYSVNIKAVLDEGEKISLDFVKYIIDVTDVDVKRYPAVNSYTEELDAPLVNSRQRQANFSLNFNHNIELAQDKVLSDITLVFDEYEKGSDGEYRATGNKVTFTAQEIINGRILVLSSTLSSKPGSVMKYMLADSKLADGYLVGKDGKPVKTDIPDYDMVSYELKESGILSVTVIEDNTMPKGSVHNSVEVKFAAVPDVSRLEGTKLLYTTSDSDGNNTTVEFEYTEMTDDPRTAVYRAQSLSLSEKELAKTFDFAQGIVLNQNNYVLITAEGDYLENELTTVIQDKSDINITYEKTKAEQTELKIVTSDSGVYPEVYVRFNNEVSAESALGKAFITLTKAVTDANGTASEDIKLTACRTEDENTVVFASDSALALSKDIAVEYAVKSRQIECEGGNIGIVNAYDGIDVSPALAKTESVAFNANAHIVSVKPYFENGEYTRDDNTLCAEVVFSTLINEASLASTALDVTETAQKYDETIKNTLKLTFDSAKTLTQNGNAYTVATYKYISDEDCITLAREDVSKCYVPSHKLTAENEGVTAADGEPCSVSILNREELEVSRAKATSAKLNLISNGEMGYGLELLVSFDEEIEALAESSEILAGVTVECGGEEPVPVSLAFKGESENTLRFVTTQPVCLAADEITTFTLYDYFSDVLELIVDSRGVGVSEKVAGLAQLVSDMTDKGIVTKVKTEIAKDAENNTTVVAQITFDEKLSQDTFDKSTVKATQKVIYADSQVGNVSIELTFNQLKDENTAVYTAVLDVPEEALGVEVLLSDCITAYSTAELCNDNRTLALSTELPKPKKAKADKPKASITAILSDKNIIDSLSDVYIGVTYSSPIDVMNLEGITLDVDVDGLASATKVTYKAIDMLNGNSLVFAPAQDITEGFANVVTLSLTDAELSFEEGSCVYSSTTGLRASTLIPSASETFVTNAIGDVTSPTQGTEPTTVPVTEEPVDKTEFVTTATADTEKATSASDSSAVDYDAVATGRSIGFISVFTILIGAFAVIVIVKRKKQI